MIPTAAQGLGGKPVKNKKVNGLITGRYIEEGTATRSPARKSPAAAIGERSISLAIKPTWTRLRAENAIIAARADFRTLMAWGCSEAPPIGPARGDQ